MSEDITSEALPDGGNVEPSDSLETVEGVSEESNVAKILSEALGKDFKSNDAAIKAVKDTFKYVGKVGTYQKTVDALAEKFKTDESGVLKIMEQMNNQVEPTPKAETVPDSNEVLTNLQKEVEDMRFYKSNPDLEKHSELLSELRGSGKSLQEVADSKVFKETVEKLKAHEEQESKKSVLQSNSRLGQVKSKIEKAQESLSEGNYESAKKSAVSAVVDLL